MVLLLLLLPRVLAGIIRGVGLHWFEMRRLSSWLHFRSQFWKNNAVDGRWQCLCRDRVSSDTAIPQAVVFGPNDIPSPVRYFCYESVIIIPLPRLQAADTPVTRRMSGPRKRAWK